MSVALAALTQVAGTSVLPCIAEPPLFVSLARMTVVSRDLGLLSFGMLTLRL